MKRWLFAFTVAACGGTPNADKVDSGTIDASTDAPDAAVSPADPLAALAALPAVCSADGWCWSFPTPSGTDYGGLGGPPNNIWLTGGGPPDYAAIMQWDGQKWTSFQPPVPAGSPEDYPPYLLPMCLSSNAQDNAWLVYNNVVEHSDGSAWSIVASLYTPTKQMLDDVWADPNGDGWVTSQDGTIRRYHDGQLAETLNMGTYAGAIWGTSTTDVFVTTIGGIFHYDGTSFTQVSDRTLASYQGVAGDVWVTGDSGIVHWDGSAFTDVTPPAVSFETMISSANYTSNSDVTWVAEGSGYDGAPSTYLHWDGTQFTTVPIATAYNSLGDNVCSGMASATTIGGKIAIVCDGGQVATLQLPNSSTASATLDVVIEPFIGGGIWGVSMSDLYMAVGFDLRHFDGSTWTSLGRREGDVVGIAGAGSGGADELFATNVNFTGSNEQYTTYLDHFDGNSWTTQQLTQYPLRGTFLNIADVYPLNPGEAMIVGGNGTAFLYQNGSATPIASGTTADLIGIWGPDTDHLSISGGSGTLLQWVRTSPYVFTPDPSFPATTDDLRTIAHAGTLTWIVANQQQYVYMKPDGGTWTTIPTSESPTTIAAAGNTVVINDNDSGIVERWDGSAFDDEYYPSWSGLGGLSMLPDGTTFVYGNEGIVAHPPSATTPAAHVAVKPPRSRPASRSRLEELANGHRPR